MATLRVSSSPELCPSPSIMTEQYDDSALEGVAANVKLLLKLIQDHKDACKAEKRDSRRMLRVATMMTILDNVRTRIQKCQSFGNKSSEAELRRCNTDLSRPGNVPRDKKPIEPTVDDKESLKKQINASLAARKSLEIMCSSLGKEKEIMAMELSRKNYELSEMEEHINDLKAQNETLLEKVKEFAAEQNKKKYSGEREAQGNAALQERNKTLSEQLLRSLDSYRSMKRKLREAQEETVVMRETMEEMSEKVGASLQRLRGFKQRVDTETERTDDIEEGISELENVFQCLDLKVSNHSQRKG